MRNPFKSEESAFRFLMGVIAYFAIIAIASVINKWAGLAVFLLMTGGLVTWWLMSRGTPEEPIPPVAPPHAPDEKHVLVIANETVAGPELLAELKEHARGTQDEGSRGHAGAEHQAEVLGVRRGRRPGGRRRAAAVLTRRRCAPTA